MSTISINVSVAGATPDEIRKQLPWAMTFAVNRTQEEVLLAQKEVIKRNLIIRQPLFLDAVMRPRRRASVKDFAGGGMSTRAVWGLDPNDFRGRASFFVDHEDGGVRTASGTRNGFLYVPTYGHMLRPTIRDQLSRQWYPSALGLRDRRAIEGGITPGADRTARRRGGKRGSRAHVKGFVIRSETNGAPRFIARRKAPGRRMVGGRDMNLEILFTLHQRKAIRPRMQFRAMAQRIGPQRLQVNVQGMLDWTLDRARQRAARSAERQTRLELFGPAGLDRRQGYRLSASGVR